MNADRSASWTALYRSGQFGQLVLLAFSVWLHAADELMVSTVTPAVAVNASTIGSSDCVASSGASSVRV